VSAGALVLVLVLVEALELLVSVALLALLVPVDPLGVDALADGAAADDVTDPTGSAADAAPGVTTVASSAARHTASCANRRRLRTLAPGGGPWPRACRPDGGGLVRCSDPKDGGMPLGDTVSGPGFAVSGRWSAVTGTHREMNESAYVLPRTSQD
jgi:hypothetical protein